MVWYKNIRIKKVTQAAKSLNDHLFLLQDVSETTLKNTYILFVNIHL